MTLTLTIGPDLLDYATWCMCTLCPIARALAAVTGQPWCVYDDYAVPLVRSGDKSYPRSELPPEVAAWVKRGDHGEPVEPIAFELEVQVSDILSVPV